MNTEIDRSETTTSTDTVTDLEAFYIARINDLVREDRVDLIDELAHEFETLRAS